MASGGMTRMSGRAGGVGGSVARAAAGLRTCHPITDLGVRRNCKCRTDGCRIDHQTASNAEVGQTSGECFHAKPGRRYAEPMRRLARRYISLWLRVDHAPIITGYLAKKSRG